MRARWEIQHSCAADLLTNLFVINAMQSLVIQSYKDSWSTKESKGDLNSEARNCLKS
jgi:hypothetical protein